MIMRKKIYYIVIVLIIGISKFASAQDLGTIGQKDQIKITGGIITNQVYCSAFNSDQTSSRICNSGYKIFNEKNVI